MLRFMVSVVLYFADIYQIHLVESSKIAQMGNRQNCRCRCRSASDAEQRVMPARAQTTRANRGVSTRLHFNLGFDSKPARPVMSPRIDKQ